MAEIRSDLRCVNPADSALSADNRQTIPQRHFAAPAADDACIVCPRDGSTFRLSDGSVRRGPGTTRQPAFETRVSDSGLVQVRPPRATAAAKPAQRRLPRPFRSAAG
jgi:hypothetical protein